MEETQIGIEFILSLAGVAVLSIPGMVFLHSNRSGIRFRSAAPAEPPLWNGWLVLLALVGYQFFLGFFLAVFEGLQAADRILFDLPQEYDLPGPENPNFVMYPSAISIDAIRVTGAMLASGGVLACWIWLRVAFKLRQPLATLGLCRAPVANLVPVILFSLFILAPIHLSGLGWRQCLEFLGHQSVLQALVLDFFKAVWGGDLVKIFLMVINAVVLAPVIEELIFRGFFFGLLRSRWGTLPALVFSSLVFAGYHFNLTVFLPLFFTSMAFGYIYSRTGSIYFSMLSHAIFNGMNLLLPLFFFDM